MLKAESAPYFMESFGKYLKTEREIRDLSLEEVSRITRIRIHVLRAIEEDRVEELPPWAYLKGFLTGYAKHIGLDPSGLLLRYQENLRPIEVPKYEPLKPQAKILSPVRRVKSFSFFALVLAIVVLGFVFVYFDSYQPPAGFSNSIPLAQDRIAAQDDRQNLPVRAAPVLFGDPETGPSVTETVTKETTPFEVAWAALGTGIETEGDRLVVKGRGTTFSCIGQRVYFFTKVQARKDGKIFHVWSREEKEFNRIEMDVRQPVWSVHSYLTLQPLLAGNWKVEARHGDEVLSSLSFNAIHPSTAIP